MVGLEHPATAAGRLELIARLAADLLRIAALQHADVNIAHESQLAGNIGRGVLDIDPPGEGGVVVLELSSYQTELARALTPDVAVFTNLTTDHLDRHGGMGGYFAAGDLPPLPLPEGTANRMPKAARSRLEVAWEADWAMAGEATRLMMQRASVRLFTDQPVERDVIERVIRAGQQAPFTTMTDGSAPP